MEKTALLTADILDILFDGRNKQYGAYELRKTYEKRLYFGLAGTACFFLAFLMLSILVNNKKAKSGDLVIGTVILEDFKKNDPPKEMLEPIPRVEKKVQTMQHVVPKIVKDALANPEEAIPEVQQMEDARIGKVNIEGDKTILEMVAPLVEKDNKLVKEPRKENDVDGKLTIVQIPASFPGGEEAWRKYLEKNLNSQILIDNGAAIGTYKVVVSFVVDNTGVISDVNAENDPGFGSREEAIRVIKKGPAWQPAIQNGKKVTYRHKQTITFLVTEG